VNKVVQWNAQLAKLMPEVALTSFTVCDAYHYFVVQAVIHVKK